MADVFLAERKGRRSTGCKRVRTPSGMRWMKGGKFVKKSRC